MSKTMQFTSMLNTIKLDSLASVEGIVENSHTFAVWFSHLLVADICDAPKPFEHSFYATN